MVFRVKAKRDGEQIHAVTNGMVCSDLEAVQDLLQNYAAAFDMDVDTDKIEISITREA